MCLCVSKKRHTMRSKSHIRNCFDFGFRLYDFGNDLRLPKSDITNPTSQDPSVFSPYCFTNFSTAKTFPSETTCKKYIPLDKPLA